MGTLFVTVWDDAAEVALGEPTQEFTVSIGSSSTQSVAITGQGNNETELVCITNRGPGRWFGVVEFDGADFDSSGSGESYHPGRVLLKNRRQTAHYCRRPRIQYRHNARHVDS